MREMPVLSRQIAEIVELSETHYAAETVAALPADVAAGAGCDLAWFGHTASVVTRSLDYGFMNRAAGLGVAEPATAELVDALVARHKAAGRPFLISLSPLAQPAELPQWLEARGLKRGSNIAKMYGPAVPQPPPAQTDLRLEEVTPARAEAMAELSLDGFGQHNPPIRALMKAVLTGLVSRPGWHTYLACDGDRPVAYGALYVRDGIGGLYGAATLPEYRGRGAQSALMALRIRLAAEQGCRWVVAETGEETPERPNPSYRNMVRAGLQPAYLRPNYVWRPDPPPA